MNSLTAALSALQRANAAFSFRQAIAFLYACENEGVSLHELAMVSRLSDQTASRAVRSLAGPSSPRAIEPMADLLDLREDPHDRRLLLIHLTAKGRKLRAAIDAELAQRRPIQAPVRAEARA